MKLPQKPPGSSWRCPWIARQIVQSCTRAPRFDPWLVAEHDGFGPWLVAGSVYSAPQHQAAHGMQMSVDTVSPSLRGYRCVHICCWPTFKILNLARERGLWSYSCIWSYSEHRGEEAAADSCSCRHRSLPSCCSHRCVTISCKLRDKLRVDVL